MALKAVPRLFIGLTGIFLLRRGRAPGVMVRGCFLQAGGFSPISIRRIIITASGFTGKERDTVSCAGQGFSSARSPRRITLLPFHATAPDRSRVRSWHAREGLIPDRREVSFSSAGSPRRITLLPFQVTAPDRSRVRSRPAREGLIPERSDFSLAEFPQY